MKALAAAVMAILRPEVEAMEATEKRSTRSRERLCSGLSA